MKVRSCQAPLFLHNPLFFLRSTEYSTIESYIDFPRLVCCVPVIAKTFISPLPYPGKTKSLMSLSRLSELILHKPIDKTLSVADWEDRPLEYAHACYAALDVGSLVKMLDVILRKTGRCDA